VILHQNGINSKKDGVKLIRQNGVIDSQELIQKAIRHIDEKLFVSQLQYTVTKGKQGDDWSAETIKSGNGFIYRTKICRRHGFGRQSGCIC
jgi:L-2-hydroxyglutarate oxidase LhgO